MKYHDDFRHCGQFNGLEMSVNVARRCIVLSTVGTGRHQYTHTYYLADDGQIYYTHEYEDDDWSGYSPKETIDPKTIRLQDCPVYVADELRKLL